MPILENVSLKKYNSFGLDTKAKHFLELTNPEAYRPDIIYQYEKILLLGGGSNVLLQSDFDGLVIKVNIKCRELLSEDDDSVIVKVGAGEQWHSIVEWSLANDWYGLENLSLIPGTIGAAPMQNIGAYGVELADVLEKVEGLFLSDGSSFSLDKDACQFSYRNSIFKNEWKGKFLISYVYLKLSKQFKANISYGAIQAVLDEKQITEPTANDVSKAVISIRQSKLPDPAVLGNAGSFFKNPIIEQAHFEKLKIEHPNLPSYPAEEGMVKVPAGWLIESAGWKGKRIGNTGAHAQQALVLVNYGSASGAEIFELSEDIMQSVQKQFGILLEREVTVI